MTETQKAWGLSGGVVLCLVLIVVVTYLAAIRQHGKDFFQPLMTLAQALCEDAGGVVVIIPSPGNGPAECLTEARALELGLDTARLRRDSDT
jgi:hypothetical protein